MQEGDWILVQGASGGVGSWLCQLLRAVGARVIGSASSDEKLKLAARKGAEFTINYGTEDVEKRVMELTGGKGVAAVFDSVGLATFQSSLQSLARDGTMVSVGNTSGPVPLFSIVGLSKNNLRLMKPSVFGYLQTKEEFTEWAEKLFEIVLGDKKVGDGVKGMIWKVYGLEQVKEAHGDLEGRRTSGKLLLRV